MRNTLGCRKIIGIILLISSIYILITPRAEAGIAFFTDEAEFMSVSSELLTQDFQSGKVSPGGDVLCSPIIDENTNDDCFNPGDILPGIQFLNDPQVGGLLLVGSNADNNPFNVLLTFDQPDDFEIRFTSTSVTAAGIDVGCFSMGPCNSTVIVSVFGPGDEFLGETTVNATNEFDSFIGIVSSDIITRVVISGPPQIFEGIDRISFGAPSINIPALSMWGLLVVSIGLCIAGLIFIRIRSRAENYN